MLTHSLLQLHVYPVKPWHVQACEIDSNYYQRDLNTFSKKHLDCQI